VALAVVMATLIAAAGGDARFTVFPLLLILSALEPPSLKRELPLIAALGLIALVKFLLRVFAALAVVAVALVRRRAMYVAVFAAAVLLAWFAAGQSLGNLPRFVSWGAEVARGYSGASAYGSGLPLALFGAVGLAIWCVAVERSRGAP